MDPVHDRGSIDPVHESGPWTRSKEGPLVHVLSSPFEIWVLRASVFVFETTVQPHTPPGS